ncbi:MAG: hypothetical protein L0332_35590 [Chloroflexi bacterium]|nr:hypothetical protein [Chloroflexota bacterium]MCI0578738.1 hypothetical protein [Chloroflexota bacterium]MCI0643977.1 hypothetical protein [Chloroflexota bacterium]MCI0732024.1 hypothetical protein [Chloroflexota bacterium]
MTDGQNKLDRDLEILEAMAAEMEEYLRSSVLFWPMARGDLPRLTLGGYLMRQHRLTALRHLLGEKEVARLDAAVEKFNQALVEKVVRFESRAHEELHARLRQWGEYLNDLNDTSGAAGDYYESAVETRAMIAALVEKLQMPPYRLEERVAQQLGLLDNNLRRRWQPGDFVWPEAWQPAYPQSEYWWLYGRPR